MKNKQRRSNASSEGYKGDKVVSKSKSHRQVNQPKKIKSRPGETGIDLTDELKMMGPSGR